MTSCSGLGRHMLAMRASVHLSAVEGRQQCNVAKGVVNTSMQQPTARKPHHLQSERISYDAKLLGSGCPLQA